METQRIVYNDKVVRQFLWASVLFGIVDKRLLESAHLSDGHELRVIDRGRPFAYRWQTTYGRRETLIPLANISEVRWDDADKRSATLTVATAGGENSWAFARDTDTKAYRSWLSARAARRGLDTPGL